MPTAKTQVKVKQPDEPIEVEVIADAIISIAAGIKRLKSSRLKDGALYLLIQHAAPTNHKGRKPSLGEIKAVFTGIESLQRTYLK